MLLCKDIETLILQRPVCKDTANQYRKSIRCFSEFLRRPATRHDLKESTVNYWLASLPDSLSPDTVRGRKSGLIVVWNWLSGLDKVKPYNPRRLRAMKRSRTLPSCWSIPQVRILLEAASRVRGSLRCGIAARDMLTAWILVGYETGLRPGDIMLLRPCDVDGKVIRIIQHKTGYIHCATITEHARAALDKLTKHNRPHLFGLPKSTRRVWELRLFRVAEQLGMTRKHRQGLGTLRKTHATEVCRISDANSAALSLGHVSGSQIARKHYISPEAFGLPQSPPEIGARRDKKRTCKGIEIIAAEQKHCGDKATASLLQRVINKIRREFESED